MERSTFDAYLACFNTKDYDGVLEFWDDDCHIEFAGYEFNNKKDFIGFYGFFHNLCDEKINVDKYISNEEILVLEARVHVTTKAGVSDDAMEKGGYGNMKIPPAGVTLEIPQYIHYNLKNGKLQSVNCVISAMPKII